MEAKDISIIYVFGRKDTWQDYLNGKEVPWLKIGQTTCLLDEDKWIGAANRVRQEKHTGIPVTCRLYEVFSYPYKTGAIDSTFRKILTDDMYKVENSIDNNKEITDPYELKAGNEFVYNVTRSQILNAQAKYEHRLLLDSMKNQKGGGDNSLLRKLILDNQISPFDDIENDSDVECSLVSVETKGLDPLMKKIYDAIPSHIKSAYQPALYDGKRYIILKSSRKGFWYSAGYSTRYRQCSVAYETKGGEKKRDELNSLGIDSPSFQIEELQGIKNQNKWAWRVTGSLDQTENQVIKWFVDNISAMCSHFENLGTQGVSKSEGKAIVSEESSSD